MQSKSLYLIFSSTGQPKSLKTTGECRDSTLLILFTSYPCGDIIPLIPVIMAAEKLHTAITAPLWTMGPSLPTAKPPRTDSVTPTALQASVLMRTSRGTFKHSRCLQTLFSRILTVLRIQDVYPRIRLLSIPDPGIRILQCRIPDPHQRI